MKWRRRRNRKRRQSHLAKRSLKRTSKRTEKRRRSLTRSAENKKLALATKLVHRKRNPRARSRRL